MDRPEESAGSETTESISRVSALYVDWMWRRAGTAEG